MYCFAFFALFATASAYITIDSKCPEDKAVKNFNFDSYGNGLWYEVGRYPDDLVKTGQCSSMEYKQVDDVKTTRYTYITNHKQMAIEGTTRLAPDAGTTGKMIHSLHFGVNNAIVESHVSVVDIDYDNYFIAYFCQYDEAAKNSRQAVWIGTRTKTMSESTKAAIDKYINESTFLDASRFEWPSFSDEDCRIDA